MSCVTEKGATPLRTEECPFFYYMVLLSAKQKGGRCEQSQIPPIHINKRLDYGLDMVSVGRSNYFKPCGNDLRQFLNV